MFHPLLAGFATIQANAPAMSSPPGSDYSHAELSDICRSFASMLAAKGVRRGDVVAYIVPNGPAAVITFLAVTAIASAAPLNPAYGRDELLFFLEDLKAKILICPKDGFDAAKDAARELSIPIFEIEQMNGASAHMTAVNGEITSASTAVPELNKPEDCALLLHTSGTTARPKLVALTMRNLRKSAENIVATLALSSNDKCLMIMPLFHIHGLVATLLAPLMAGGSVVCPNGFNALTFFDLLERYKPSWYSGVPSMHQTILQRAARNKDKLSGVRLRFIRSSSAALAPSTFEKLSGQFNCPVIEAYGMTEAAHQITSNTLDSQKAGMVGWPFGTAFKVADEAGAELPDGTEGEVLIAGESVHAGYLANSAANEAAFVGGFFRTGDLGIRAQDGSLRLTGRLKEIINRGGEKIAPLELDNIALQIRSVKEAIAFAIPHEKLGEDIALAVVIDEGSDLTESEIKAFFSERVAAFKVPRKIIFLDAIPKGATGKIQRLKLAEQLGC